jgi:hypothetical protein
MLRPHSTASLPRKRLRAAPKITTRTKYPFPTMEVGEFFFVPHKTTNTMMAYASTVGRQMGKKFSTRLCTMKEQVDGWILCEDADPYAIRGIGIWRLK